MTTIECVQEVEQIEQDIGVNIFRYKLREETTNAIYRFAKLHEYDTRESFKEAWLKWIDSHVHLVEQETRHHYILGYEGNVLHKMFKSARYYFRHKTVADKKQTVSRSGCISCPKQLLNAMEHHIRDGICRGNFKPSDGFQDFIEKNDKLIEEAMSSFVHFCHLEQKLKKTYKNRYFRITKNSRQQKSL